MKTFLSTAVHAAAVASLAVVAFGRASAQAPASFRVGTPRFTMFYSGQAPGFSAGKSPSAIVEGPDGNIWFTELVGNGGTPGIARMTQAGRTTEFPTGNSNSSRPLALAVGADKNLWFADPAAAAIGRMTTLGKATYFRHGLSHDDFPAGIAAGVDGALWFVSDGQAPYVGKVSTDGTIVEVAHFGAAIRFDPSLTIDARGNAWLTGSNGPNEILVRVDAAGRPKVRVLAAQPGLNPCCVYETPQALATRRDGSVWFTNLFYTSPKNGNHPLGEIDADGLTFSYPSAAYIGSVARGLGNDLWFANQDPFYARASIGTVGPHGGIRSFPLPRDLSPLAIAVARDGSIWMSGTTGSGTGVVIRATP